MKISLIASNLIKAYVTIFSISSLLTVLLPAYAGFIRIFLIVILWILTHFLLKKYDKKLIKNVLKKQKKLIIIIFICLLNACVVTLVFTVIPLVAIIYSAITYLSFLPITYLFLIIRSNLSIFKEILKFLIYLCIFHSIGVIIDGIIGIDNLPLMPKGISAALGEINTVDITGEKRGSFFLGTSTSIFPFLSVGMLSSLVLTKLDKNFKNSVLALISFSLTWLALFFSLSRTPLVLGSIFILYCLLSLINSERRINSTTKILFFMFIIFIITVLLFSDVQNLFLEKLSPFQRQRFEMILSAEDAGNEHRFNRWSEGLNLFVNPEAWLGHGLASSNYRMGQIYGYDVKTHYESSLFLSFSEAGFAGIIARLAPAFYIIKCAYFTSHKTRSIFIIYIFLFVSNLCISPLINEYSVQISYFLVMGLCIATMHFK